MHGDITMTNPKSRIVFLRTEDRKMGVVSSIKALNINPVKNKDVLIKSNFDTAPSEIDVVAADDQSREYRDRVVEILNKG